MERIPREETLTVGASSVEVSSEMPENTKRVFWAVTNVSTGGQIITINIGKEATANRGIILYPTGSYAESQDSQFTPTRQRICAIASAAGGSLSIHERVE